MKDGLLEGDGRAGRGWDGRADGEGGSTKLGWEIWTVGGWSCIFSFILSITLFTQCVSPNAHQMKL